MGFETGPKNEDNEIGDAYTFEKLALDTKVIVDWLSEGKITKEDAIDRFTEYVKHCPDVEKERK